MSKSIVRTPRAIFVLALAIAGSWMSGHAESTKVGKIADGKVCFTGQECINVGAGTGRLAEGPFAGTSEWIVEVRDAKGKVIDRVKPGGEIIFISPEAYAKRDGGKDTFVIARTDKSVKPVKTNFVHIQNHLRRSDSYSWSGVSGGAFGMTALPPETLRTMLAGDKYRTGVRGRLLAGGRITGISEDGTLTESFDGVVAVQAYGDYNVLMFEGGVDHQVSDWALRSLSPKTDSIYAFAPAYKDWSSFYGYESDMVIDYPAVMYGVVSGTLGNGQSIYQLLPRRRGETYPPELIGYVALDTWSQSFNPCPFGISMERCKLSTAAFGAMWATPDGLEMTLHHFDGELADRKRYAAIDWWGGHGIEYGIVEELNGNAHLVVPSTNYLQGWTKPDLVIGDETFAGLEAARNEINRQNSERQAEKLAAYLADEARRADELARSERDAEYLARLDALRREELIAVETQEIDRARELEQFGSDKWEIVCREATGMQTVYARNIALAHCGNIKPEPYESYQSPSKRDFWGDLALALDAWSSLSAQGGTGGYAYASPPASGSPDWDYVRSMKSIDTTVRLVTDPNWNGAAARANR